MFTQLLAVTISNDALTTAFLVVWIIVGILWLIGWLLGRIPKTGG